MKKFCLLFATLFSVNVLFSQILYKEGIVKGKNVTYEVIRGKGLMKHFTFIRNMNNPDTTFREVPGRDKIPAQMLDIEMQVAEIMRDYLSLEEVAEMYHGCLLMMTFRLDTTKRKLLQVTHFFYLDDEPFWANFSPDRLYELEQAILEKLELPAKLQETYFKADFMVGVFGHDIQDIKETRKRRKSAIKEWKHEDIEVKVIPRPELTFEMLNKQ